MKNKNIHTFIGCDNEYKESKIVIFGAPFDSTTSFRPGTRFASAVMRNESFGNFEGWENSVYDWWRTFSNIGLCEGSC